MIVPTSCSARRTAQVPLMTERLLGLCQKTPIMFYFVCELSCHAAETFNLRNVGGHVSDFDCFRSAQKPTSLIRNVGAACPATACGCKLRLFV